ncbi:MAG: phage protein Gp36 family protein [Deltaproteobacteria bacterium]
MAQAPVPTRAEFLLRCVKPEAFEDIDPAIVDACLADETDTCAAYYGDRATLPLLKVDGGFIKAVCRRASLELMASRGYNRQAGADDEIAKAFERATAWLEGVSAKEIHPYYEDSKPYDAEDGPIGATSKTSDAWTRGCSRDPERCC